MCGIVGAISRYGQPCFSSLGDGDRLLEIMLRAIEHRGYDGQGTFFSKKNTCILGHRRLAIVDKNDRSNQPMISRDGRYALVFNGEIYNYRELRVALQKQGYSFVTDSDTEVVLGALVVWGAQALEKFRGMFAIAFWDEVQASLLLARDHLGIKPLYIGMISPFGHDSIVFGSELKIFQNLPGCKPRLSAQALKQFLAFYSVAQPLSMLKDVTMLLPGQICNIQLSPFGQAKITYERYWSPASIAQNTITCDSYEQAALKTRVAFIHSIDRHRVFDTKAALFLSGGLDSAAIAGCMQREFGVSLDAYTVGYEGTHVVFDESSTAKAVAQFFGHNFSPIFLNGFDVHSLFPKFLASLDQPSGDGLNSFLISSVVGKEHKVAFSGIGGDELFYGYTVFQMLYRIESIENSPAGFLFLKFLKFFWNLHPKARSLLYRLGYGFARLLGSSFSSGSERYFRSRMLSVDLCTALQKDFAYALQKRSGLLQDLKVEAFFDSEKDRLRAHAKAELSFYLPNMLLRDTDALSMASTLEVRVPFLDLDLVSLVGAFPSSYAFQSQAPKQFLKDALKDFLPPFILQGVKQGFELPIRQWMLDHFTQELVALEQRPWVEKKKIQQMRHQLLHSPGGETLPLWSLLVLDGWCQANGLDLSDAA